jgi:DNA helicase-2/ATP-dependent DNA helicase PcrA
MGNDEDIDLLAIDRGLVTAPAGCGKTELIARSLARHDGPKPILVLTHTNAGVAALRGRLNRAAVSSKNYRLVTIDGWAMRLISTFPKRSGQPPELLELLNPAADYPEIRKAAARLLQSGCISDILSSSYAHVIVDEYQDCSTLQHTIVVNTANVLPTAVLGDHLQAIFNFGSDKLADWKTETCKEFPEVGALKTPWRWINAKTEELGHWLLDVRERLRNHQSIDLKCAPKQVLVHALDGSEGDHKVRLEAARVQPSGKNESVIIIGESTNRKNQQLIASQTPGAITVEAVDFRDLIAFARSFDLRDKKAISNLAHFGQSLMTNAGAEHLIRRLASHRDKTARTPPTELERSGMIFVASPSHAAAVDVLVEMNKQPGVRVHRPEILSAAIKAFKECGNSSQASFHDAAIRMRERNRMVGRRLGRRTVGSTLLVKGLEAEVSVVLHACELDAPNLYVAMTRGSKLLVLCSKKSILKPK